MSKSRLWGATSTAPSTSTAGFYPVNAGGSRLPAWGTTHASRAVVIPTACTIGDLTVNIATAPGSGKEWTFSLVKNGTPVVDVTISGASTTASTPFSAAFSPGDTLSLRLTPSGTPAASGVIQWSMEVDTEGDGESLFVMSVTNAPSENWRPRFSPPQGSSTDVNTTRSGFFSQVMPMAGTLSDLYVVAPTPPGASKSVSYTLYKNGVATALTCTISGTDTAGSLTGVDVSVAEGDRVEIAASGVGGNTPTMSPFSASMVFTSPVEGEWPVLAACGQSIWSGEKLWTDAWGHGRGSSNWTNFLSNIYAPTRPGPLEVIKAYVWTSAAPGSGRTRTLALQKGSSDEASVTLTDAETAKAAAVEVSYDYGDTMVLNTTQTGSASSPRVEFSFVAYSPTQAPVASLELDGEVAPVGGVAGLYEWLYRTVPAAVSSITYQIVSAYVSLARTRTPGGGLQRQTSTKVGSATKDTVVRPFGGRMREGRPLRIVTMGDSWSAWASHTGAIRSFLTFGVWGVTFYDCCAGMGSGGVYGIADQTDFSSGVSPAGFTAQGLLKEQLARQLFRASDITVVEHALPGSSLSQWASDILPPESGKRYDPDTGKWSGGLALALQEPPAPGEERVLFVTAIGNDFLNQSSNNPVIPRSANWDLFWAATEERVRKVLDYIAELTEIAGTPIEVVWPSYHNFYINDGVPDRWPPRNNAAPGIHTSVWITQGFAAYSQWNTDAQAEINRWATAQADTGQPTHILGFPTDHGTRRNYWITQFNTALAADIVGSGTQAKSLNPDFWSAATANITESVLMAEMQKFDEVMAAVQPDYEDHPWVRLRYLPVWDKALDPEPSKPAGPTTTTPRKAKWVEAIHLDFYGFQDWLSVVIEDWQKVTTLESVAAPRLQVGAQRGGTVAPSAPVPTTLTVLARFLVGLVAPTGGVARGLFKNLFRTRQPTGALRRRVSARLAAVLTSSAVLGQVRSLLPRVLTRIITPTGTAAKQPRRTLRGILMQDTTVTRRSARSLAGGVSPVALLSSLGNRAVALLSTVSPVAGLRRRPSRRVAGSVTASGAVARTMARLRYLVGTLTPSGAIARRLAWTRSLGGTVTPSAGITRRVATALASAVSVLASVANERVSQVFQQALAALVGTGSALARSSRRGLGGEVAPTAGVRRFTLRGLVRSLAPTGGVGSTMVRGIALVRTVAAPVSEMVRQVRFGVASQVLPQATRRRLTARTLQGGVTPQGRLGRLFSLTLARLVRAAEGLLQMGENIRRPGEQYPVGSVLHRLRSTNLDGGPASAVVYRVRRLLSGTNPSATVDEQPEASRSRWS